MYRTKIKMKCVVLSIVLLFIQVTVYAADAGKSGSSGTDRNTKLEIVEEIIKKFLDEYKIPGLSAALAIDNELIWSNGFGYANLQHMVPAGAKTVYRIASISKPIASVIAMMLVEEETLDLDAAIQDYIPLYPEKSGVITMRRLLSHTSGIRHYRGDEFFSNRRYRSGLTPLATFADDTLLFMPGDQYSYSTFGYTLASAVIEASSRTSFIELLKHRIAFPYGLSTISVEESERIIPHLASFYIINDGEIFNAPFVDNSNKWAGGGLVSSADDLVRFASELIRGNMIYNETLEQMFTPQTTNDGNSVGYGLGWAVGIDEETGKRVVWHTGGAMGGSGLLLIYPDDGVIFASLANTSGVRHLDLGRVIVRLFFED
jgi:serine beta-lactamase-like protein LACTB, mitochondrial